MKRLILGTVVAAAAMCAGIAEATCTSYPYTLINGSTADATQVMANFNCAALLGGANFTGGVSAYSFVDNGTRTYFRGFDGSNNHWFGSSTAAEPIGLWLGITGNPTTGSVTSVMISPDGNGGIFVKNGGNIGLATSTPAYLLDVNGSMRATNYVTSDARLKKDIVEISDALSLVRQLRGVRFHWRPVEEREVGKSLKLPVGDPQIGVIAQEVMKVVPEAVVPPKTADEVYAVREESLIPVLIEAVKEQQIEIEALRSEVAGLKASK